MADDRYGLPPPAAPAHHPPAQAGPAPDPWSTGYPPTTAYPTSAYPPGSPYSPTAPTEIPRKPRRVPRWVAIVGAATAVASVISFVTVLLWPSGGGSLEPSEPLQFRRFASVHRFDFGPSNTVRSAMIDNRGYTAWEQGGAFHVKSFNVQDGTERWQTAVTGDSGWAGMSAVTGGVAVFAHEEDAETPRAMYMLSAESGQQLWSKDVRADDRLFVAADGAIGWLDRQGGTLRGLDATTGAELWSHSFSSAESSPVALSATTEADLAEPSTVGGTTRSGSEDTRIALVDSDLSVQVIEGSSGKVISRGSNIADPEQDQLLAYEGRLYVAPDEGGYRLISYDLANLNAQPQVHYTAANSEQVAEALEPCGSGRVCLLEQTSYDVETSEIVAVDPEQGRQLWRSAVAGADGLLPVGDWVAVDATVDFEDTVVLLDGSGARALDSPGQAVRLNDSNLLVFEATLDETESQIPVRGIAIDNGALVENVELGELVDVQGQNCSWNEHYVVCPNRAGAEIWQFAETGE